MAPNRGRKPSGVHTVRSIHCKTGVANVELLLLLLLVLLLLDEDEDEEDEEEDS